MLQLGRGSFGWLLRRMGWSEVSFAASQQTVVRAMVTAANAPLSRPAGRTRLRRSESFIAS
jgi:hypothetical protein